MKNKKQLIDHPSQLEGLSVIPGIRTPAAGKIEVVDEELDQNTREQWSSRLNSAYFACGCAYAAMGLVLGIAAAALVLFTNIEKVGVGSLTLIALPVSGLILGKIIGLTIAQSKLKSVVREIKNKWQPSHSLSPDDWVCG